MRPPQLEQYLKLTQDGLVQWAGRLGWSVALVAQEIFADQAVDGMPRVRALIRLGRHIHDQAAAGGLSARHALRHAQLPQRQEHPRPRNWTACNSNNRHSTRTDRSSSGSHASTATSTPTTPRRRVKHQ